MSNFAHGGNLREAIDIEIKIGKELHFYFFIVLLLIDIYLFIL